MYCTTLSGGGWVSSSLVKCAQWIALASGVYTVLEVTTVAGSWLLLCHRVGPQSSHLSLDCSHPEQKRDGPPARRWFPGPTHIWPRKQAHPQNLLPLERNPQHLLQRQRGTPTPQLLPPPEKPCHSNHLLPLLQSVNQQNTVTDWSVCFFALLPVCHQATGQKDKCFQVQLLKTKSQQAGEYGSASLRHYDTIEVRKRGLGVFF